jgi:hypothetical protein
MKSQLILDLIVNKHPSLIQSCQNGRKGLLRRNTGRLKGEKRQKSQRATIALGDFHLSRGDTFSVPYSSNALLPNKKREGKFLVYFRFLIVQ